MPSTPTRPRLLPALARAVLPAYLVPAVMVSANAALIDRPELAHAAVTTIAVPGAVAAALVTLRVHRRTGPPRRGAARAAATAAVACAALAAAVCAVLVGNGLFDAGLFLDAVPSAAIGGAVTAATAVRAARRAARAVPLDPAPVRHLARNGAL